MSIETMEPTAPQTTTRILKPCRKVSGELSLPGDKSISHRAALLSLLCDAPLTIINYSDGIDCQTSLRAIEALGASVARADDTVTITPPEDIPNEPVTIDCGNSGTTARLSLGLLSGLGVTAELTGDESLSKRPMRRVLDPLSEMGARFNEAPETLPIRTFGGVNKSLEYELPKASAQIKSAILLAAQASGVTAIVTEPTITRDHTERMLQHLGANITINHPRLEITDDPHDPRKKVRRVMDTWARQTVLKGDTRLKGGEIDVPGDISTAAYFFAAAAISKGTVTIHNVGLNPTRDAFLDHLKNIGCTVEITDRKTVSEEPRGTVTVTGAKLKGRKISGATTAALIDELPIITVMACFAEGPTVIRDAAELRVKESDRIETMAVNLRKIGAKVGSLEDGMAIEAEGELQPADFDAFGDHRIAMSLAIASLFLSGESTLTGADACAISCPKFFELLDSITKH